MMLEADPNTPYATAAGIYAAAGWEGIIPLPVREKWPPPRGYTGHDGAYPNVTQIDAWRRDHAAGNIGLRLPPGLIGIDVDDYDGKQGGTTFRQMIDAYGPLPPAWTSTSRDDGRSGIRIYRLPEPMVLNDKPGPGIEIIQRHHRYVVAWPSIHPDTGAQYGWITPDGEQATQPPTVTNHPLLPPRWVDGLRPKPRQPGTTRPNVGRFDSGGQWTPAVENAYSRAVAELPGGRHDAALHGCAGLVRLHHLNYPGAGEALQQLENDFIASVSADGTRKGNAAAAEWKRMLEGAEKLIASTTSMIRPYDELISDRDFDVESLIAPTPRGQHLDEDIELIPLDEETERPPFPTGALPPWAADHVTAVADSLQVPVDLPASLVLGALSLLASKRTRLQVRGPWIEHLNLYLAVAMPPGSGKSPAFRRIISIIEKLEAEAKTAAEPKILEAELRKRTVERKLEQAERGLAMGSVDERDVAAFLEEMATSVVPARPKWVIDDATPEYVAAALAEQGGRIAFLSTEGGVFDQMTGRYSERSNLDVYLQGWSGDHIRVDRITRSSIDVPEAVLTMAVTVQPSVIKQLSERPELAGRGLTARFMYSLPEPLVGHRDFIAQLDRPDLSADTTGPYEAEIRRFNSRLDGPLASLELDRDAVLLFTEYRQYLEKHRGPHGLLEPLAEWTTKLESSIARLAGILHIASDRPGRVVTAPTMLSALEVGRYWLAHAQVVHRMWSDSPALGQAKAIVEWLTREKKTEPFPLREVYNANRRRFPKAELTVEPLQILVDRGWLRTEDGCDVQLAGRGGRGGTRAAQMFTVRPAARREMGF